MNQAGPWLNVTALRPLLGLSCGIVLQDYWNLMPALLWTALACCSSLLLLTRLLSLRLQFRWGAFTGSLIMAMLILAGALNFKRAMNFKHESFSAAPGILVLLSSPERKPNSFKVVAAFYQKTAEGYRCTAHRMLVYFPLKDSTLTIGNTFATASDPQPIKNTGNPGSFDYARYCSLEGISTQLFLKTRDHVALPAQVNFPLTIAVDKARSWLLQRITRWLPPGKEKGLAEALLIGYKPDLDADLVQSYTNTGVIHVIAISGMHIGLVFGILGHLTVMLKRKKLHLLRLILMLTPLWFFSLMAGAEASVLRSAVMFSLIGVAIAFKKRNNVYQALAASALILLVVKPTWLFNTGFLLSYSAVLSILIFHPLLIRLYKPSNPLINWFWQLLSATLAAQILTTPISIAMFHQFPFLFLLTNLVAVPLSSVILILLLTLAACADMSNFARPLGSLSEWCIRFLNNYIEHFSRLPINAWHDLLITSLQAALLLSTIFSFYFFLSNMRPFFFKAGLVCALCFTTLRSLSFHQAGVQCRAAVLNVPRNSISIFVRGRKAWVWSEQVLTPDQIKRFVAPAFLQWRINSWKLFRGNAFEFANRKFLVGDHVYRAHSRQWCDSLPLDYAIITASEIIPEQFLAMHKPHCLILSRSLSFSKRKQWQEACQKKNITCYNIVDKGAFVVNLEPLPLSP